MTGTAITRRQILLVSLLLWAGSFLYLTLAPALPKLGSVDSNDYADWGHVVGTMGLAVILYLLIAESVRWPRWRAAVVTIVTASAFGVAIEILQGVDGARDPAVSDALYDALGAAVAVAVLTLLPRRNRVLTALVAVGTAGFTVLTVVAAVFLTPVPVGDLDCSVAVVAHHTPSPRPPSGPGRRATRGLVALYVPGPETGATVPDLGGEGAPDLRVVEPGVTAVADGLHFSGGLARTGDSAATIIDPLTPAPGTDPGGVGALGRPRAERPDARRDHLRRHRTRPGRRAPGSGARCTERAVARQLRGVQLDDRRRRVHRAQSARAPRRSRTRTACSASTCRDAWSTRPGSAVAWPVGTGGTRSSWATRRRRDRPFLGDVSLVAVYDRALERLRGRRQRGGGCSGALIRARRTPVPRRRWFLVGTLVALRGLRRRGRRRRDRSDGGGARPRRRRRPRHRRTVRWAGRRAGALPCGEHRHRAAPADRDRPRRVPDRRRDRERSDPSAHDRGRCARRRDADDPVGPPVRERARRRERAGRRSYDVRHRVDCGDPVVLPLHPGRPPRRRPRRSTRQEQPSAPRNFARFWSITVR